MKGKKMLALALAGACMLGATACGNSQGAETSGEDGEHLTVAWWGNQVRNERTSQILNMFSEENPGVTIDGQFSEFSDYWNKLATSAAGGALPDVIQMDYQYYEQYVDNGLLLDLTPYIESGDLDVSGIDEGILQSGSTDGKVYAICNGVNAPALIYNKTLLDENGITIKDNMTLDEFMDVCREVYEKTGYRTHFRYQNSQEVLECVLRGQGEQLFADGALGVKSADSFKPFFEVYQTGLEEGWMVKPDIFTERSVTSVEQDPLVYGNSPEDRSWCALQLTNQLTAFQNATSEDIELAMTTWPSANPKASNYLKPSQFFCVSASTQHPKTAVKLLDYITNSVECNEVLLGERGIPASSVVADAIKDKLDPGVQDTITYLNEVVTPNSSPINPPAPAGASEVNALLDEIEEKLCYGQISVDEAAEQLFTQGNAIMQEQ